MSLFKFVDKTVCPCTMNTKVLNMDLEMKCVLPRGHTGLHLSPWGRWFNIPEKQDEVSRMFDNPNAKSATGKKKVIL